MTNSYQSWDEPTTDLGTGERPRTQRRFALVSESGEHITSEIEGLLRRRLRVAALITLAGFGLSLVRALLAPEHSSGGPLDRAFHALVVAVIVAVTTVLWSGW